MNRLLFIRHPIYPMLYALLLCSCSGSDGDSTAFGNNENGGLGAAESPHVNGDTTEPSSQAARLACRSPQYSFDQGRYPNLDLLSFDTYQQPDEFVSLEHTIASITLAGMVAANYYVATSGLYCNYVLYEANGCSRLNIPGVSVEVVSLQDQQLSFNVVHPEDSLTEEHVIDNRDYDSGSVRVTDSAGTVDLSQWSRDPDGTEKFSRSIEDDERLTYSWVEKPDCSGNARLTNNSEAGETDTNDLSWTSPLDARVSVEFTNCRLTDGTRQCFSGTY